jgi:cell division protein FtsW
MRLLRKILKKIFSPSPGEHEADFPLLIIIGIFLIFGMLMLSSATAAVAYSRFGDTYFYFKNQLFALSLGLIAFYFLSKIDYRRWKKFALIFLIFSVFLLILVFIPGLSEHYGKARRWINIFGFYLQPSEIVKISFLIYLAAWLEKRRDGLRDFHQGTFPFLIVLGIIAGLMLLQPDLGTLLIIVMTSLIVYFVGGGKKSHIIAIILIGIMSLSILVQTREYQMNRIKCMLDPSFSPQNLCYQINQSLIAVGSGGIFGRGFGQSRQKFFYLPEVSGDSIFPIISEEIGFVFSSLLVILYMLLFYRGYLIAKKAPDMFGRIMAIGIVSWIFIQAAVNIGGMIALMPMTGAPLPFISYGGTAILAVMSAMGILVNISKQTKL